MHSFPYIGVGKVSYSIFRLVLYSARSRLELNGVQFFLLHYTEKLTYSILYLATRYSARSRRVTLQRILVFEQIK